ncbi:hypothetical protein SLEP1_g1861 [Rubroshorea leprosula]|uniref:Uncharacterized protein n=1 Tax=Rubroshorea leprosula TaxID=152421 RepID=A0AAV5HMC5_9ROSI|nr:hypothetical protein SLEP1_g1861 [Rubroshorea leprosula]
MESRSPELISQVQRLPLQLGQHSWYLVVYICETMSVSRWGCLAEPISSHIFANAVLRLHTFFHVEALYYVS